MLIKNCVLKHVGNDIWLHHTASSYKVRMNAEAVGVLESMAARGTAAEMTEKERYIYDKLAANGIAGEAGGRPDERRLPVKRGSPLESLELEFSGRCNLTCAHCFSALSQKNMGQETLDRVFAGIDALEPVTLLINGGEPLVNPLLPDALKKARARHMRVNVMTNATLADERTAALFAGTGVAKAVVSLDFFEDTHDIIRGAGTFKQAVRGIKHFVAAKVPVLITAMVQDSTAGRVEDFQRFCLGELGASGVRFSAIMPIGKAKGSAAGLELSAAGLKDLFTRGVVSGGDENEEAFTRLAGSRNFYCNAGIGQCYISADGKVYACHYFQNIGETMGDLADKPLEAIHRAYAVSGAIAADYGWEKLRKCKACGHFARCKGGCRARAKILSGGWYDPDAFSCGMYGVE
ncbi:MAG: radical SAM protein [Elusimicrobiota bacterium]|nr:radical SAM protein [Elusimicrobiota bacterium]